MEKIKSLSKEVADIKKKQKETLELKNKATKRKMNGLNTQHQNVVDRGKNQSTEIQRNRNYPT